MQHLTEWYLSQTNDIVVRIYGSHYIAFNVPEWSIAQWVVCLIAIAIVVQVALNIISHIVALFVPYEPPTTIRVDITRQDKN